MAFPPPFGTVYPCLPWRKIRFQTTGAGETQGKFFLHGDHRNRQVHEQRTEALERSIQAPRAGKIAGGQGRVLSCRRMDNVWKPLEEDGFATVRFTP